MDHDNTIDVGLDVHKDSITAACVGSKPADVVIDLGRIGTQQYAIERLIRKLSGRGRLELVYEAGPCGFWLQRYLHGKDLACTVMALSPIPKRPGERIKTDWRDARNLAQALRAGHGLARIGPRRGQRDSNQRRCPLDGEGHINALREQFSEYMVCASKSAGFSLR